MLEETIADFGGEVLPCTSACLDCLFPAAWWDPAMHKEVPWNSDF